MFKLFAACAFVVAAPLAAADDAAAPAAATAVAPAKEKQVCQRINEVGSRGYKKICQTEAQWRAQREQEKRDVSERDRSDD